MSLTKSVKSYQDLEVWQRSMKLTEVVYQITSKFPSSEQWGLTIQMRRASISIPSNIAEGFGRQSTGDYRRHLSIARGSLLELETQLILAGRLKYLETKDTNPIINEIQQISRMLATLVARVHMGE